MPGVPSSRAQRGRGSRNCEAHPAHSFYGEDVVLDCNEGPMQCHAVATARSATSAPASGGLSRQRFELNGLDG